MARVPEEEIDRIKREVSVENLARLRGVKLSGGGDNLKGLCPFHDDHTPSLVISPSKNVWHCLGACQGGGSVIDWVMRAEGVSFRLAVEMLRARSPSLVAERPASSLQARMEPLARAGEPDAIVLRRVVEHYHARAKESAAVREYLASRGLAHPELVDAFRLGFSDRTLGYRLGSKVLQEGASVRAQLTRLGIMRESGHEHMTGSLVIPVFGEDGDVLELYGRKIHGNHRPGAPKHLYLSTRADGRRGVFNHAGLRGAKDVIVCEALIDALTFWCAGFRGVTSAYGVEGFTAELRSAVTAPGVERVLIAYDRDEAGDRAAAALASSLEASGVAVYRVQFPKGMDANEYASKVTPASKSLDAALRAASWMCGARAISTLGLASIEREVLEAEAFANADVESPVAERSVAGELGVASASSAAKIAAAEVVEAPEPLSVSAPPAVVVPVEIAREVESRREPAPTDGLEVETRPEEVSIRIGSRRWRARGLAKNLSYETLRVTLSVSQGSSFFVDTLELYSARHRAAYLKQAAEELGVEEKILKGDLGRVVLRLEELVHAQIQGALEVEPREEMSEEERASALELLRDPRLLDRVLEDFEKAGVVGEETNKLMGYLAAVSRKLETPLAVVIQSSSAAGKSSLMDAVLRFMPPEERVQYSAMTGQSLFYMGETNLSHKILAIAEEEGAQSASYALKLLQSEGELTIASTGKDPSTGRLVTQEYRVEGPVMIFMTTTAIEVDEELLNRCVVLTVDEGAAQTSAIHAKQRAAQTLEGLLARHDREHVVRRHQNAQRLLEPLLVANPFASELRFSSRATRSRRDHMKYLTLIRSIALLHQHQRSVKTVEHGGATLKYIEVTREDIARADALSSSALSDAEDELPPQTRRLLEIVRGWVGDRAREESIEVGLVRFTRKELRDLTRWSDTPLRKHLGRLVELEHLVQHGGGGNRRATYELALGYDGAACSPEGAPAPRLLPARSPGVSTQTVHENMPKTVGRGVARSVMAEARRGEVAALAATYPNSLSKVNGAVR